MKIPFSSFSFSAAFFAALLLLSSSPSFVEAKIAINSPAKYKDDTFPSAFLNLGNNYFVVSGKLVPFAFEEGCELAEQYKNASGIAYIENDSMTANCKFVSYAARKIQEECAGIVGLTVGYYNVEVLPFFFYPVHEWREDTSDITLPIVTIETATYDLLGAEKGEDIDITFDLDLGAWIDFQGSTRFKIMHGFLIAFDFLFFIIIFVRIVMSFRRNSSFYLTIPFKIYACLGMFALFFGIADSMVDFNFSVVSVVRKIFTSSGYVSGFGAYILLLVSWSKIARILSGKGVRIVEYIATAFFIFLLLFVVIGTVIKEIYKVGTLLMLIYVVSAVSCLTVTMLFFFYGVKVLYTISSSGAVEQQDSKSRLKLNLQKRMTILVFVSVFFLFCFIALLVVDVLVISAYKFTIDSWITFTVLFRVICYIFVIIFMVTVVGSAGGTSFNASTSQSHGSRSKIGKSADEIIIELGATNPETTT